MFSLCKNVLEFIKNNCFGQIQQRGFFVLVFLLLFYSYSGKYGTSHNFDYLIFSQRWLPTSCIEYVEKNNRSDNPHFCVLPKNFQTWKIHGLWPTRNKSIGPFFCNKSMPFDFNNIKPIESILEQYWPNIEGGKSVASLWQHEWEKHGTCAAQLQSLNSEINYFNVSMSLYKKFNMQDLFIKTNLYPNKKGIDVSYLFYLIKSTFEKVPKIHCIIETKTKQPYLSEIRLCFNKNLKLIDCGKLHSSTWNWRDGLTNCPEGKAVLLPDNVNPTFDYKSVKSNLEFDYFDKLYKTLLTIRLLQWASI